MSTVQLTNLKLFFTRFGGIDLPVSHNWFEKFGFDATYDNDKKIYTEYKGPIYKHSLMNVLNNFDVPKMFSTKDQLNQNKSVSDLTIVETEGNEAANDIAINSTFWSYVLKLLELIVQNQASWKESPSEDSTDGTAYSCYGDQKLRSKDNAFEDVVKIYKPGSLNVVTSTNSSLNGRILSCTFTVIHTTNQGMTVEELAEDGTLDGSSNSLIANMVTINAYFNPDTYITVGATTNYKVYSYEDLNNNNEIDDSEIKYPGPDNIVRTEFDLAIAFKLTNILKNGKYTRHIRFCPKGGIEGSTFYINKGTYNPSTSKLIADDGTEITSENMKNYGYNKPFYIFTSLDESQVISDATLLKYVREYINENLYVGDDKAVEKMKRFPNLFQESTVSIYPMLNNKNINGAVKAPIDGKSLSDFINLIGLTGSQYELFHVGRSTYGGGINTFMSIPLFASENDVNSTSYAPISSRFPTYRPIYSSADDNKDVTDTTIIFHDLCILALSILMGTTKISSVITESGISPDYRTLIINGAENSFVTSAMNFTETTAGTNVSTGETYNHSVSFTYKNVKYKFIQVITV